MQGRLFYGDNLDVLRENIPSASIDLIYLDPPFNSNRSYNVIFAQHGGAELDNAAQIQAFDDTWRWTHATEEQYRAYVRGELPNRVINALTAFRTLLGENDALAYLVNMAPRLVELHRALKDTGSLYLHCDPTMSHYLKVLLDAIFGAAALRNEIIWRRTSAHSSSKKFGPVHDVILYYAKGPAPIWNTPRTGYTAEYLDKYYKFDDGDGRLYWRADLCAAGTRNGSSGQPWRGFAPAAKGMHWKFATETLDDLDTQGRIYWAKGGAGWPQYKRYRDELKGLAVTDLWDDIDKINPRAAERLGYPTQKPLALLERIITASSREGDVVLDPFCGCGTAVDSAVRLNRQWVGIDITYLAVDLIERRLQHTYGESVRGTYEVRGIPRDVAGAQALFDRSPFDFERWAVSLVNGTPNEKQVGDRGIDGVARFFTDTQRTTGRILISVKGGRNLNPGFVRDLLGTVDTNRAEMGTLVTLRSPTRGIADAIDHSGSYLWPVNGQRFPKAQMLTVPALLAGGRMNSPPTLTPYISADRHRATFDQLSII